MDKGKMIFPQELEAEQRAHARTREAPANMEVQLEFQRRENDELRRLLGRKAAGVKPPASKRVHQHNDTQREVTLDPDTYGAFMRSGFSGPRTNLEQYDHDPEAYGEGKK